MQSTMFPILFKYLKYWGLYPLLRWPTRPVQLLLFGDIFDLDACALPDDFLTADFPRFLMSEVLHSVLTLIIQSSFNVFSKRELSMMSQLILLSVICKENHML